MGTGGRMETTFHYSHVWNRLRSRNIDGMDTCYKALEMMLLGDEGPGHCETTFSVPVMCEEFFQAGFLSLGTFLFLLVYL